jgi:glutamate dehydrogenase
MILDTAALLRQVCYWLVQHCRGSLGIEAQVERLRPGMLELVRGLPGWLGAEDAAAFRARVDALGADGVPADLARNVAGLSALHSAPDIIELAKFAKLSVTDAARAYVAAGAALGIDWLRQSIGALDTHGHWHAVARGTLREAALDAHRRLTQRILASGGRERDPARALARWTAAHAAEVAHARDIIDDIRAQGAVDFASLSVALQAVRRLAGNEA